VRLNDREQKEGWDQDGLTAKGFKDTILSKERMGKGLKKGKQGPSYNGSGLRDDQNPLTTKTEKEGDCRSARKLAGLLRFGTSQGSPEFFRKMRWCGGVVVGRGALGGFFYWGGDGAGGGGGGAVGGGGEGKGAGPWV